MLSIIQFWREVSVTTEWIRKTMKNSKGYEGLRTVFQNSASLERGL